ncbi:MAG: DUF975 family protein [Clostridia bacterium]
MMLGPFYFKQKARAALKGNWQTALLVTFFSGVLMTCESVLENVSFPNPLLFMPDVQGYANALIKVPHFAWIVGLVLALLAIVFTPVLSLGSNHYFVCRLHGEELGFRGLFSRMRVLGRALWLYIVMGVRIFLWSLLLLVPGIIAAIRYSMAPYYMAEDPSLTAVEAIEKSKHAMQEVKMGYFMLMFSFVGWSFLATTIQLLLIDIDPIVATVAGLFMQLFISVYMNGACASFYLTVSDARGMDHAKREMEDRLRQMGVNPEMLTRENNPSAHADDEELDGDLDDDRVEDDRADDDGADDADVGGVEESGSAPKRETGGDRP